jgi:hypothetical protein
MQNANLELQHRSDIRPYLEAILDCVKSLHTTLSAVMADVAAIRKTVFEDTENIELYRTHLKTTIATTKPMVEEAMLSYDYLMQEIIESQRWEN